MQNKTRGYCGRRHCRQHGNWSCSCLSSKRLPMRNLYARHPSTLPIHPSCHILTSYTLRVKKRLIYFVCLVQMYVLFLRFHLRTQRTTITKHEIMQGVSITPFGPISLTMLQMRKHIISPLVPKSGNKQKGNSTASFVLRGREGLWLVSGNI